MGDLEDLWSEKNSFLQKPKCKNKCTLVFVQRGDSRSVTTSTVLIVCCPSSGWHEDALGVHFFVAKQRNYTATNMSQQINHYLGQLTKLNRRRASSTKKPPTTKLPMKDAAGEVDDIQVIEASPRKYSFAAGRLRKRQKESPSEEHRVNLAPQQSASASRRLEINGDPIEEDSDISVPYGAVLPKNPRNANRSATTSIPQASRDTINLGNDDSKPPHPTLRRSERQKNQPVNSKFFSQLKADRKRRETKSAQPKLIRTETVQQRHAKKAASPVTIELDPVVVQDHPHAASQGERRGAIPKRTRTASPSEARTRYATRSYKTRPDYQELEQEEVKEELKSLTAVDASYEGPTHIIFKYPPGQRGKITITAEERGRLQQHKYLNDSLIDFYLKYLETVWNHRPCNAHSRTKFFSSFFFGVLRRSKPIDYVGVKSWTKGIDLFATQFVFVPICDSYHWSLVIVANLDGLEETLKRLDEEQPEAQAKTPTNAKTPRIIYLDSLDPKRGLDFGNTMRRYLVEEWICRKEGKESNPTLSERTYARFKKAMPTIRPSVPIQNNEYDCGLYLLNSLAMFLDNLDSFREKMLNNDRSLKTAYNHVDIQMLRKEIMVLMDCCEKEWNKSHTDPESAALLTSIGIENTATRMAASSNDDAVVEDTPAKTSQVHVPAEGDNDVSITASLPSESINIEYIPVKSGTNADLDQKNDCHDSAAVVPDRMDIEQQRVVQSVEEKQDTCLGDKTVVEVDPNSSAAQPDLGNDMFHYGNGDVVPNAIDDEEVHEVENESLTVKLPSFPVEDEDAQDAITEARRSAEIHPSSGWQGKGNEEVFEGWVQQSSKSGDVLNQTIHIKGLRIEKQRIHGRSDYAVPRKSHGGTAKRRRGDGRNVRRKAKSTSGANAGRLHPAVGYGGGACGNAGDTFPMNAANGQDIVKLVREDMSIMDITMDDTKDKALEPGSDKLEWAMSSKDASQETIEMSDEDGEGKEEDDKEAEMVDVESGM